ncbi:protein OVEREXPRESSOR OF CATIONIC PEROXIDASE 3-like isoform X3 [Rhododendron vialii]|uniref:protein OVEREXPRESSOR OF CATIONIC PEROXIDASE 3-like isoform X3 n=1 Tax=Rhododendron vialii TaxID=182163 RepID=UPI00265FEC6C|nr:protein OVEREXPRESSOR OF CATIONIC PEROXIDASE 3-like isoform X3 [Rhododendron vialii]
MAAASSSHSSITLRYLQVPQTQRPLFPHLRANLILQRHPSPHPVVAFARPARRRNTPSSSIKSSKKKKKRLPRNDVAEEEDSGEDALEALFSQLEEDLENDDQSLDDDDDDDVEMGEEDLANLERELAEALEEDKQLGSFDSHEDDGVISESEDDDDDDDIEEDLGKLKNWQLRRLAYALKNGRRKTGIKNLAADVCLDRAVVLKLLRDPPPKLLLMSATLPDKPISPILEPKSEPLEKVSSDAAAEVKQPKSKVEVPVHVMQSSWSGRKRLKKVQVRTLERVYARTKRPTNTMVDSIVSVTKLPRKKVLEWFEDKRSVDGVPGNRLPYQRTVEVVEEEEEEVATPTDLYSLSDQ